MGKLRLRVAVVALAAVIAGVVGFGAPAGAASTVTWSGEAATIDCSTLQSGYYHSMHLTASLAGLPTSAQYVARVYDSGSAVVGADIPVATDAQGVAAIDTAVAGSIVSGEQYGVVVWSGTTDVADTVVQTTACASGVAARGTLTADAVCTSRFLGTASDLEDTAYRVHGSLTGFVPGETYTLSTTPTSGSASAVADPSGAVAYDLVVGGPLTAVGAAITTTSQTAAVGHSNWALGDPCPAMKTYPLRTPTNSDVNGDGLTDILAIDYSGNLLFYPNLLSQNPGGHPFVYGRAIGSGWGPQFGLRMEVAADITGDGPAEIVAVRTDGTLVAYYNNLYSNPPGMPYTTATVIGSGWQPFTHITIGDVNHDGYGDLIAERSDGTYWLYLNHYATNPGHLPFTSGVRIDAPGPESAYGYAAVDFNWDGYADLWSYGGWLNPNRTPAGNSQFFGTPLSVAKNALSALSTLTPQTGWVTGQVTGSVVPGLLVVNPNGDGTLRYFDDLSGSGNDPPWIIGDGWQRFRQVIP